MRLAALKAARTRGRARFVSAVLGLAGVPDGHRLSAAIRAMVEAEYDRETARRLRLPRATGSSVEQLTVASESRLQRASILRDSCNPESRIRALRGTLESAEKAARGARGDE